MQGTKILPEFADLTSARTEGIGEYTNREGIPLHLVFRRLQTTGWLVAVGVKVAVLDASARNTIAYTATAGALVFAFAIGLTHLLGGRLEHRFGTLGIDRKPTLEEFALFFDSAPNGVVLVDDNGIVLLTNATLEQMFGYTQRELIGQPVETLIPSELRERPCEAPGRLRPQSDTALGRRTKIFWAGEKTAANSRSKSDSIRSSFRRRSIRWRRSSTSPSAALLKRLFPMR